MLGQSELVQGGAATVENADRFARLKDAGKLSLAGPRDALRRQKRKKAQVGPIDLEVSLLDYRTRRAGRTGFRLWHLILVAALWFIVMHTVLFIVLLTLGGMVLCGVLMIVGLDDGAKQMRRACAFLRRRNPRLAARVYRGLDAFAYGWDAVLDRFPDGTVDALYPPDLSVLVADNDVRPAASDSVAHENIRHRAA